MEVLSRGGPAGRGGRGGRGFAGGRGRGGRGGRGRGYDAADELELYVGDNADGEKLAKRLGEANMNKLVEGFEEMSSIVFPSPVEEAYLDALHTNNLVCLIGATWNSPVSCFGFSDIYFLLIFVDRIRAGVFGVIRYQSRH